MSEGPVLDGGMSAEVGCSFYGESVGGRVRVFGYFSLKDFGPFERHLLPDHRCVVGRHRRTHAVGSAASPLDAWKYSTPLNKSILRKPFA